MDPVVHIGFEVLDVSHPMRKLFVFFLIPRLVAINYKCRIYCHFFWDHSANTFLPQQTALWGLSHFLQPAWVCIVAPGDWWVGKRRRNLSPGYSAGLVMDGPSEVLEKWWVMSRRKSGAECTKTDQRREDEDPETEVGGRETATCVPYYVSICVYFCL